MELHLQLGRLHHPVIPLANYMCHSLAKAESPPARSHLCLRVPTCWEKICAAVDIAPPYSDGWGALGLSTRTLGMA